nr:unnamed protein product [Digitaria exilis]
MAEAGGEAEAEYESGLDDAHLPAARCRAAASDDEEEEEVDDEGGGGSGRGSPPPPSTVFDSESEPDGQGKAELYDDGGDEGVYGTDDDECDDLFEEGEAAAIGGGGGGEVQVVTNEVAVAPEDEGKYEEYEAAVEWEKEADVKGEEEVKKGSEPYAEPTAGAFYQHDTRCRVWEDSSRGHQRKAIVPSASIEHGTAIDSHRIVPIDTMTCSALHPVATSHNYSKDSKFWDQDRDLNISEIARPSSEPQIAFYQQRSVQPPVLPMPRAAAQIIVQKDTITNNIQSHPRTTLISVSDDDEATALPETNSSLVLSAVTAQDDMKEAERSCFLDGGNLVVGDTGERSFTLDEPCSTGTPAKLPVMLFGDLHPRGSGFPSVAMVLPGFVVQQCDGNSEIGRMTCTLPILTGATGVREGTSSPPNFGSNCPQPSGFASSLPSPRFR